MPSATPSAWAQAYATQARADLSVVRSLLFDSARLTPAEYSVVAMLLQMVLEKLAKAALLQHGGLEIQHVARSHATLPVLRNIISRRGFLKPLQDAYEQCRHEVRRLERLHPSLAGPDGPQLEYPWVGADDRVRCPATDLGLAQEWAQADPRSLRKLLHFVSVLDSQI